MSKITENNDRTRKSGFTPRLGPEQLTDEVKVLLSDTTTEKLFLLSDYYAFTKKLNRFLSLPNYHTYYRELIINISQCLDPFVDFLETSIIFCLNAPGFEKELEPEKRKVLETHLKKILGFQLLKSDLAASPFDFEKRLKEYSQEKVNLPKTPKGKIAGSRVGSVPPKDSSISSSSSINNFTTTSSTDQEIPFVAPRKITSPRSPPKVDEQDLEQLEATCPSTSSTLSSIPPVPIVPTNQLASQGVLPSPSSQNSKLKLSLNPPEEKISSKIKSVFVASPRKSSSPTSVSSPPSSPTSLSSSMIHVEENSSLNIDDIRSLLTKSRYEQTKSVEELVQSIKGGLISNGKLKLKRSFCGADFIDLLVKNKYVEDRHAGVQLGIFLQQKKLIFNSQFKPIEDSKDSLFSFSKSPWTIFMRPAKTKVFGGRLDEIMNDIRLLDPSTQLPRVVVSLTEAIFTLGGDKAEGIFRKSEAKQPQQQLKDQIENGDYEIKPPINPHIVAGVLTSWFLELENPIVPEVYYNIVPRASTLEDCEGIVLSIPEDNRNVIVYMIRFLGRLATEEVSQQTKMGPSNLAMVFSPCFFHLDSVSPDQLLSLTASSTSFLTKLITASSSFASSFPSTGEEYLQSRLNELMC